MLPTIHDKLGVGVLDVQWVQLAYRLPMAATVW